MNRKTRREFLNTCFNSILSISAFSIIGGCKPKGQEALPPEDRTLPPSENRGESAFSPPYLRLHQTGELKNRGRALWKILGQCELCPRQCGVNRFEGNAGFCQASAQLKIASFHPHFGEERALVGEGGSGTVFFSNCGLRCVFCINWDISHGGKGRGRSIEDLAKMMLKLQHIGCYNINVVTPTHYAPHIVLALDVAAEKGLRLPLVYNTCGWERVEILRLMDGIVDIYLPDFKYFNSAIAATYSADADTYPEVTKAALLEMHRQVGIAKPGKDGIMYRGLMIRHLVMPNEVSGTKDVIGWIAANLPRDTYVNLMSQYQPVYKAMEYPEIARKITREEYTQAVTWAREAGLTNVDVQGYWF